MDQTLSRRTFLMAAGATLAGATLRASQPAGPGAPNADKLGWRLGCQAWTFNSGSFYEAIDRTAQLGLHYIEGYPDQKIGGDRANDQLGPKLSADARKEVKKRLADKGVTLVNFGVGPATREAFDFAKDMGIETLVSEPKFDEFDALDKLVEEYKINIALHDHPKPSPYWDPEIVLKVTKGRSKRIGACCDTGHWMRSDIKPVDALKKLEGRIISFHVKDLNEYGRDAHDVPWGTGRADVKAMLTEVKRQGVKPVFSMEYEYRFTMAELAECVAYFNKVAGELAGA